MKKILMGMFQHVEPDEWLAEKAIEDSGLSMSREVRSELFPDRDRREKLKRNEKITVGNNYIKADNGKCYLVHDCEDNGFKAGDMVIFEATKRPRSKRLWAKNIRKI